MSEPIFNSDLTMEQIEKNFEGMDFFAGLMEGLQEAYACEKGKRCSLKCWAYPAALLKRGSAAEAILRRRLKS